MKGYSLNQDHQRTPHLKTVSRQPASEKKGFALNELRKIIFALIALAIAGFLLLMLQKPEQPSQPIATAAAPSTKQVNYKTQKNQPDAKKKIKTRPVEKPSSCIKTKVNWRKNLLGETVLSGTLNNTAIITHFKDPVIEITWLSKTKTELGKTSYPLYEYIGAGKTISYKLKLKAPFKFGSVDAVVKSATAIQ